VTLSRVMLLTPRGVSSAARRDLEAWVAIRLQLLQRREEGLEAVTGLCWGPDLHFAAQCYRLDIPLLVIASCLDQEARWDPQSKALFTFLCEKAASVSFAVERPYERGCVRRQARLIQDALLAADKPVLLAAVRGRLSLSQERVAAAVKKKGGSVYVYELSRR